MIVQVCPPGAGGVRDYADCLARAWAARGVATTLIEGQAEDLRAQLDALVAASPAGAPTSVVLHFSGYGYAPRGLCGWLPDVLVEWRTAHASRPRLVVVFHELFAGGAPWRSAFWLAPWQSQVARRLARLADGVWTNTAHHAAWLRGVVGGSTPLHVHPVFSNVGELGEPPAWHARAPRAVVFGSEATRQRAFAALRALGPALVRLGVHEIVEAGTGRPQSGSGGDLPTRHAGRLSPAELGTLLAGARFGIVDYPARYLGKSGVFAACAAHGCAVIDTRPPDGDADGLRMNEHFVNLHAAFPVDGDALARMATRLHRWYVEHSLALQSRELLQAARADAGLPPGLVPQAG